MIDVSNNNGHVNWAGVRSSGHKIAAIKAAEGSNNSESFFNDAFFTYNMLGAKANGILACPYYFARPGTPAERQARHFLEIAHNHIHKGAGKLILDIEDSAGLGNPALIEWVREFCSVIESVIHSPTILYSYTAFLEKFGNVFVHHPLWVANYNETGALPPHAIGAWSRKMVYAHQFTETGRCAGIDGNVDLSRRFASLSGFTIGRRVTWVR